MNLVTLHSWDFFRLSLKIQMFESFSFLSFTRQKCLEILVSFSPINLLILVQFYSAKILRFYDEVLIDKMNTGESRSSCTHVS